MNSERDLLNELDAPVRSFRLFAIEQIIQSGSTSEVLQALQARLPGEDDQECRIMLEHAITMVRSRVEGKVPQSALPPADFPAR